MNKGTAIVSILIAFVGGFALGNLFGGPGGSEPGTDIAVDADGAGSGEGGGDGVERFRVPVDGQPSKGPDDALVTIVEFSDFECPFCSRVGPTMSQIMNDYRGKVRIVWRNNPLPFHRNAGPAAQAAMEAFEQGGSAKFWAMHDKMFENQRELTRENLEKWGQEIGLNVGQLRAALDNNEHQAKITADQQLATRIGARGTPHFFINGRRVQGAQPVEAFKEIIDDEIRRGEALVSAGTARNRVYADLMRNALAEAQPEQPAAAPDAPPERRQQPDPNAVYRVPVEGRLPQKGPNDALVTIVQFSDFECPFCGRVEPTMAQIVQQYGNDVRIVWMNNPLPFHQNAGPAAQAAMEAFDQGGSEKFWAMHGKLFENQRAIARENLEQYAQQIGLNMAQFRQALDNNEHQAAITEQQNLARGLGASGTPSFFINGRNLRGAQPFEAFKAVIDQELEKAREKVRGGTPRARVYAETIRNGATTAQFLAGDNAPAEPAAAAPDADRVYEIAIPRDAPRKGGRNARVTMQIFSDFECPFCGRVMPTMQQIEREYGDRIQIIWRNYPLPFHQNAGPAAQAAVEVHRQGGDAKFWAFHDKLFENQRAIARADLERYAEELGGINMAQFRQALDNNTHQARVQQDMDAVQQAGARIGTPSFFINGRLLQGAQPFEQFKAAIDRAMNER